MSIGSKIRNFLRFKEKNNTAEDIHKKEYEKLSNAVSKEKDKESKKKSEKILDKTVDTDALLTQAYNNKNYDLAKFLISNGADSSKLLFEACMNCDLTATKFLIEAGAGVNTRYENNKTPLHFACESHNYVFVNYLITKGANVNAADKDGITPFHVAFLAKDSASVDILIQKKANVDALYKGKTLLYKALNTGNVDDAKRLINAGADVNAADKDGKTALNIVCESTNPFFVPSLLQLLLDKGANVNSADKNGITPFHVAFLKRDFVTVDILAKKGANPDALYCEYSLLHHAVMSGNLEAMKCLVKAGANVNAADKDGKTSLHHACASNNFNLVQYLADQGANVDIPDNNGQTPLHYAVFSSNAFSVSCLVKKGADPCFKDKNGKVPSDYTNDTWLKVSIPEKSMKTESKKLGFFEKKEINNRVAGSGTVWQRGF